MFPDIARLRRLRCQPAPQHMSRPCWTRLIGLSCALHPGCLSATLPRWSSPVTEKEPTWAVSGTMKVCGTEAVSTAAKFTRDTHTNDVKLVRAPLNVSVR